MKFKRKWDFQHVKELGKLINEEKIQLINAQSSWDRYSSILAKWRFAPHVKIIHTRRQKPLSEGGILQRWFYQKGVDGIVAVSPSVKQKLIELGYNAELIKVIHNGTPASKYKQDFREKARAIKERLNIGDNEFVIGCIARKKQQEQLLEALGRLSNPLTIILVGISKQDVKAENLAQALKAGHKIYFEGEVAPDHVLAYYLLLDCFVLPSDMEGLSQSLLEAMAMGVPVIATNAGGNPDLIKHGKNGLLFEDKDTDQLRKLIQEVRESPEKRTGLIQEGKKTAFEDFSLEKTIADYENYFSDIITHPPF